MGVSRRDKRAHLDTEEKFDFIHDDLDDGVEQFKSLRREIRLFFVAILVAVVGVGLSS